MRTETVKVSEIFFVRYDKKNLWIRLYVPLTHGYKNTFQKYVQWIYRSIDIVFNLSLTTKMLKISVNISSWNYEELSI